MTSRSAPVATLLGDRRAATAFEYAVIAAFVALVISGALTLLERI